MNLEDSLCSDIERDFKREKAKKEENDYVESIMFRHTN